MSRSIPMGHWDGTVWDIPLHPNGTNPIRNGIAWDNPNKKDWEVLEFRGTGDDNSLARCTDMQLASARHPPQLMSIVYTCTCTLTCASFKVMSQLVCVVTPLSTNKAAPYTY